MRVDRINYQKTFNLGNYTSERVGLEAELESGDDAQLCILELKKQVELIAKVNNPNIGEPVTYSDGLTKEQRINMETWKPTPPPVIDRKAIDELEIKIDNVANVPELMYYEPHAIKYGVKDMWDKKLIELKSMG